MSLNNFEEQLNKNHTSQINLIKHIRQNKDFFNNVNDDFIYKPWINFIINDDQESFDKFADSDLSWNYIKFIDHKIQSNGLRQEKLHDVDNLLTYQLLLHNFDSNDELPIEFIEHYANINDVKHKLLWFFISANDIDKLKLYLQYYTFDPKLMIEVEYYDNNWLNLINISQSAYYKLKETIEIHFDDYATKYSIIADVPNDDVVPKIFQESNIKSEISYKEPTIYKSVEITEDNILQIIWQIKEDRDSINYLSIANYFEFMSLSERTEWWYRIVNIPENDFNYVIRSTTSEIFLDYVEEIINKIDVLSQNIFPRSLNLSVNWLDMSQQFINRLLKKKPELKDDMIKYAIKSNIGLLHYLMPDATTDDILHYLE